MIIDAARFRKTFQSMVTAIVGADAPPVRMRGSQFLNIDRWSMSFLIFELTTWAKANVGKKPTVEDLSEIVHKANSATSPTREIVIASCPAKAPLSFIRGVQGGACHESFHTLYSCRRDLEVGDVEFVLEEWDETPWEIYTDELKKWFNIVEDIRIEKVGGIDFPSLVPHLHALQDIILSREEDVEGGVIARGFRDLGLGYPTDAQNFAIEKYQQDPHFERLQKSPLREHLQAAKALGEDSIEPLRIAMRVVSHLHAEGLLESLPEEPPPSGSAIFVLDVDEALTGMAQSLLSNESGVYRPFDDSKNERRTPLDNHHTKQLATQWLSDIRPGVRYLQHRLGHLLQAEVQRKQRLLVKRGRRLSSRSLVNTAIELRSRVEPSRAFERVVSGKAKSAAVGIVIDESSSMQEHGKMRAAATIILGLAQTLELLNVPTMAVGVRDSYKHVSLPEGENASLYHSLRGVIYDVFMRFGEPFTKVMGRFGDVKAVGGTPLAEGIAFALEEIRLRPEEHRLVFVITDGQPNCTSAVKSLLKTDSALVIGVGVGPDGSYVQDLFEEHVYSPDIAEIAPLLTKKLSSLLLT